MDVQFEKKKAKPMSNLPLLRFTTIATLLVAVESLVCIALWLSGGDSLYLEDSVEKFMFTHSTFDLACLAAIRCAIVVACLFYLESNLVRSLSVTKRRDQKSSLQMAQFCLVFMLLVILITLVYALVKGVLVLVQVLNGQWNQDIDPELRMSVPYMILCIVGVVFPAVDVVIGVISWWCVKRMLHVRRIRLIVNETEGSEESEEQASNNASLRRIALLAKPEYPLLLLGCVCLVLSTGAFSVAPLLFGRVITYAIPGQTNCTDKYPSGHIPPSVNCTHYTIERMNMEVVYLVAIFTVGCIAVTFRSILFNLSGERFVARLRKQLFKAIISQEMGFFDKSRTGELTNRLAADTQVVQSAVTENLSMLARYTLQMLISIGLMFYINAKLTAVLLSVVPIIAVAAVQYGRFLKRIKKDFQDKLAHASSTAEESISNIITVRSFSNEVKMAGLYSEDIDKSYSLGKRLAFMIGGFMGTVSMFMYGAAALVLWYGGYLVWHKEINPGTLISLMLYTLNLAMAFAFLSNLYGEFMQAVGASVRIFQLLDRECTVPNGTNVLNHFEGEIIFEHVNFRYPSRPEEHILKDLSFEVKPGQVVALVGPSGGGKSTVVKLIEYFYNLSSGHILVGGRDVRDLDPSWFRKHIGLVSQEPVLFACSIRDNIRYGNDDATQEEIEDAAEQANAHEFITSFEEGYETMVGERGVRLSGGQKQRIAIARALLLNPDILLLDEATSALDAESEHLVKEAIDRAMKGRTVIVIAHRLSTVRNASQVIVIEHGKLVEQGTHDELIAANGIYKQLVLRQLTAGELQSEHSD